MGWHRNHAISHSPNQNFFEDTFVSHPGGPNEQFGTHEKLSWGGVQGNLNWMPGYCYYMLGRVLQSVEKGRTVILHVAHSVLSNSYTMGCPPVR